MADAEQTDLIAQFSGVTGVAGDRAKFYLESSAWQLEVALASFFDNDDGQGEEEVLDLPPPPAMPVQPPSQPPQAQPIAKPVAKKPKNTSSSGGSSRFATIGSMMQAEESDSEDEGQAFYAGGSETSGQQILGPNRKKTTPNDIVENMFKAAKDHGAEVVEAGSSEPRQRGPTFEGTGYRLGDTEVMTAGDVFRGAQVARPKQRDLVLKLWKNGFSIDDGPLRDFKDPQNKEFLDAIHKGEVPNELVKEARGAEVSLNMEDHRNEDFVAPKKAVQAFGGAGHTLGSPAPNVQAAAAAGSASAAAGSATQASSAASVSVDPSQPTTSLQIRLSDGSRMVAKFNHTHKVSDVRAYILGSHPQMNGSNFVLMTTFPNKELSDESVTLAEAKLLNAVLVQRMK